jgi:hypothetical protein
MSKDDEDLQVEYDTDIEYMHAKMLQETGKSASRALAGNVRFVAKQQARHHVIKGLMKK